MAEEIKLLVVLLTVMCAAQLTVCHSLTSSVTLKRSPRAAVKSQAIKDESRSDNIRTLLADLYFNDLHREEAGNERNEPLDFSSSSLYTMDKPIKFSSSSLDQLEISDNKAVPVKRFSEFLGGKRFSEFLGGKRKRFSEFLGGKKRYSEFLGGKKRISSTEEVFDINNKRFSEFLGGKRSSILQVLDPADSMELATDTRSLYDQQVVEY